MKLHRDASATIDPQAMAYYQTPATPPSTWRTDLARIGIVCALTFVAGAFATITAVIFWRSWQTVGVGMWLTALAIVAYLAWYALRIHRDVAARSELDQARMWAERDALLTAVDINNDGTADATEVDAFINYVRRLHRGEATTAAYAQQTMSIAGPDWQDYKTWLIAKGYANLVKRRGGSGFALKPSVMRTPWPKLEDQLRQRMAAGLRADGLTITSTPPKRGPIERVSTLDD